MRRGHVGEEHLAVNFMSRALVAASVLVICLAKLRACLSYEKNGASSVGATPEAPRKMLALARAAPKLLR
eukprot:9759685-Alexandrium_andersonii.AAC.1